MNFDDILKNLNDPEFNINTNLLIIEVFAKTSFINYNLAQVLKQQIELKELIKGNSGQEAESNVASEFDKINQKVYSLVKQDLIDFLDTSSKSD